MQAIFKILQPADFTSKIRDQIIDLGMRSGTWQDVSAIDYYEEQFKNLANINVVYQNENGLITGYALAKPHNEAVLDYLVEDPAMKMSDIGMSYVDIVITDIKRNHAFVAMHLVNEIVRESNRRGVSRFSLHCRVINGFSKIIQRKFRGGVEVVRRIDHYVDCNDEPFDYIEGTCTL